VPIFQQEMLVCRYSPMVLFQVQRVIKGTTEALCTSWKVAKNPMINIKSDVHPRLIGRPQTYTEYIRSFGWRHTWKYVPLPRIALMAAVVTYVFFNKVLPLNATHWRAWWGFFEHLHHAEQQGFYGSHQRFADQEYFDKYNPLRKKDEHVAKLPLLGGGDH